MNNIGIFSRIVIVITVVFEFVDLIVACINCFVIIFVSNIVVVIVEFFFFVV